MQQRILEFNVIRLELQSSQPLLIIWDIWKLWQHTVPLQKRWAYPGNCYWHSTAKPSPAVPEQVTRAVLCPCREAVLDTVTSRAGRCQVLLWCFRAHLLALSLTSSSLRCPGWVNSPSIHRTTLLDLSEGLSHPQWNYPPCYFPSHHDTSFPWRNEGIHSEWQISPPSLNWPSTASSAPLFKVPPGDRQTNCECQ